MAELGQDTQGCQMQPVAHSDQRKFRIPHSDVDSLLQKCATSDVCSRRKADLGPMARAGELPSKFRIRKIYRGYEQPGSGSPSRFGELESRQTGIPVMNCLRGLVANLRSAMRSQGSWPRFQRSGDKAVAVAHHRSVEGCAGAILGGFAQGQSRRASRLCKGKISATEGAVGGLAASRMAVLKAGLWPSETT